MKTIIRLFKGLEIESLEIKNISKKLLEVTVPKGFIFSPEVISNYTEKDLLQLVPIICEEIGLSGKQINNSFHKSWNKVKTASMNQLVCEQIIHYMTTYGFEDMGIYSEESVYIPNEKLEIPWLKNDIKLQVIGGFTKQQIEDKLLHLLGTGIALNQQSVDDCIEIIKYLDLNADIVEQIKNKEVKIILYDHFEITPQDSVEFLRYVIYKITGKSLLIKNFATFNAIKEDKKCDVSSLFIRYKSQHGLNRLASIFNRFKPLFLSFKSYCGMSPIINKIRKLSKKHHKPMPEDLLNEITAKIKKGETINIENLKEKLNNANIFRKIRLAYALKFRTKDSKYIIYKIRNGKSFATEGGTTCKIKSKKFFDIVYNTIVDDISKYINNKKIYIPQHITYALPTTEKQFTGDFPSGTYITTPKDMIFGICWDNVKSQRIDLDLSLVNEDGKIGWDGAYRNNSCKILFSGDMTDSSKGASELFYVQRNNLSAHMLYVNYYNFDENVEVPFKIIVGKTKLEKIPKNYMLDPNDVLSVAKTSIDKRQLLLGLLVTTTEECRFYYTQTALGNGITSGNTDYDSHAKQFLFDYYDRTISLNQTLKDAGAIMVEDINDCDIDLSPEVISKDSIIKLITGSTD